MLGFNVLIQVSFARKCFVVTSRTFKLSIHARIYKTWLTVATFRGKRTLSMKRQHILLEVR
jgi:hypothetical protein